MCRMRSFKIVSTHFVVYVIETTMTFHPVFKNASHNKRIEEQTQLRVTELVPRKKWIQCNRNIAKMRSNHMKKKLLMSTEPSKYRTLSTEFQVFQNWRRVYFIAKRNLMNVHFSLEYTSIIRQFDKESAKLNYTCSIGVWLAYHSSLSS